MTRDHLAAAGCVAIVLVAAILGGLSVGALSDGDAVRASRWLTAAVYVVVIGLMLLGGAVGVAVWRDKQQVDEAYRGMLERAERLRRERAQARASARTRLATPAIPAVAQGRRGAAETSPSRAVIRARQDLGECPVCQNRIRQAEAIVTCPVCKAMYHEDCWLYNGGCAVFGCKGRS